MVEKGDRRAQILDAAFEEFVAKGYHGATIKGIAAVAGLRSPALIYWYFPNKEVLFKEVLSLRPPIRTGQGARLSQGLSATPDRVRQAQAS